MVGLVEVAVLLLEELLYLLIFPHKFMGLLVALVFLGELMIVGVVEVAEVLVVLVEMLFLLQIH
jgi:hypothetical protein